MTTRKLLMSLTVAFLVSMTARGAQSGDSGIEGSVVRAGTGAPIAGAQVTLVPDMAFHRVNLGGPPGLENLPFPLPEGEVPAGPPMTRFPGPRPGLDKNAAITPVTTDAQGRFTFSGVSAGKYSIRIVANGYVAQTYGQRQATGPGAQITLTAGQTLSDIAVRMTPAGNISGRIRDQARRPLPGVPVQLLRATYTPTGEQQLQPVSTARTNDRGEYRLFWVNPGRYYLKAGNAQNADPVFMAMATSMGRLSINPNEVPSEASATFFPGVRDFSGARAVELAAGAELAGIDWALQESSETHRIRVRIVDSGTGRQPQAADVILSPVTPGISTGAGSPFEINGGPNFTPAYNAATGIAEFRNVEPGVYAITAMVAPFTHEGGLDISQEKIFAAGAAIDGGGVERPPLPPLPPLPPGLPPGFPQGLPEQEAPPGIGPGMPSTPTISMGSTTVAVSNSDVDDAVITVAPTGLIQGKVLMDGEGPPMPWLNFQLTPIRNTPAQAIFGGGSPDYFSVGDGAFRISNVPPGEYRIATGPLPEKMYLKEARLDGADVLNAPLVWRGGTSGVLEVVISSHGGQIRGTLLDERATPIPVTQVVLIPDRNRERVDLYKTVTTGADGRFTFTGVTPGAYKVFSWENVEPYGWFDPNLLERSESKASPVTVAESATENVEVQIISQGSAQ